MDGIASMIHQRIAAAISLASAVLIGAQARADEHVIVSWHTEAPDMTDVRDFNDSGSVSIALKSNCGTAFQLIRIHAFDYFLGSSRGSDHKPLHDRSAGLALTIQISSSTSQALVAVDIAAGQADWTRDMHLAVPIYSPDQLEAIGPEVTWVVPQEGFTWPRYWKSVRLKCRDVTPNPSLQRTTPGRSPGRGR
jgi:hypothetical protein